MGQTSKKPTLGQTSKDAYIMRPCEDVFRKVAQETARLTIGGVVNGCCQCCVFRMNEACKLFRHLQAPPSLALAKTPHIQSLAQVLDYLCTDPPAIRVWGEVEV